MQDMRKFLQTGRTQRRIDLNHLNFVMLKVDSLTRDRLLLGGRGHHVQGRQLREPLDVSLHTPLLGLVMHTATLLVVHTAMLLDDCIFQDWTRVTQPSTNCRLSNTHCKRSTNPSMFSNNLTYPVYVCVFLCYIQKIDCTRIVAPILGLSFRRAASLYLH